MLSCLIGRRNSGGLCSARTRIFWLRRLCAKGVGGISADVKPDGIDYAPDIIEVGELHTRSRLQRKDCRPELKVFLHDRRAHVRRRGGGGRPLEIDDRKQWN